jgi:hypothetical protein
MQLPITNNESTKETRRQGKSPGIYTRGRPGMVRDPGTERNPTPRKAGKP